MEASETVEEERRRRRWPLAILGVLVLLFLALLVAWLMRFTIASDFIDDEFEKRGVQASYEVKRIGFRRQWFENLVIGDPRRPDLTARRVEIELSWGGFGRPSVAMIRARGVRLRGRVVGGRVTFGQLDRLLPPPSGAPFRLPDQRVDVADTAIVLDTPAGRIAAALTGRGNLSNGFRGHMATLARRLQFGECTIAAPSSLLRVAVDRHRPSFAGPVRLDSVACADDFALTRPRFEVAMTLAEGFDSWRGGTRVEAARMQAGPNVLARVGGNLTFDGTIDATRGRLSLASAQARVASFRAASTRIAGDYAISPSRGHLTLDGEAEMRGVVVGRDMLQPFAAAFRSAEGTPVGPIGRALADSLMRAGTSGAQLRARMIVANRDGAGVARFENLAFAARSGARLRATGGSGLTYSWPGGRIRTDGQFALSGGGLPSARFTLRQTRPGGPILGVGTVAPISVGRSRLALSEVRFTAEPSGTTRFETQAVIDGPFRGGRVEGLAVPLRGRFGGDGFALGEECVSASFRRLVVEDLVIGPSRLPLCPSGRAFVWKAPGGRLQAGAEVRAPRFAGRLGRSPIAIGAQRIRFDLGERGFTGAGVTVVLGGRAGPDHRLSIAELRGRFNAAGVVGTFSGLSGKIAAVPLLLSEGSGNWHVQRGDLAVAGRLTVADEREPARFHPLLSDDFRLALAENQIRATGWLKHPASGTRVTHATIDHDLRRGVGRALLDVPGIAFDPAGLQPEDITRLTVGVVALVDGAVTGRGRIDWRPGSTTSTGTFSVADMNLAAAFGPVEGLTTTVNFTDLLRLESAPGQVAHADMIRAGIDVADGTVRYQLRQNSQVQIEGGRWPFAGGELLLQPTVLDFSRPSTKFLTFQVVGLDAAIFVEKMGFTGIELTGIFDGVLPMQFDISGGRIVGGKLEARPGGGTLSYVGEISDENLGTYGRLAFDALRSLRYSRFYVQLDGALAGEFLTRIQLDGITLATRQNWIVRRFANIPFRFNIAIRGPLRAVIATARGMRDPSLLIQPVLPEELRDLPTTVTTIQDEESETVQ